MNEEIRKKAAELKNKKIAEKYKILECITILRIKEKAEVDKRIITAFDEIRKIEYSKSFSTKECDKVYKYIEYLYEKMGFQTESFWWLIPGCGGGCKWYEIKVHNLHEFFEAYFEDGIFCDFSCADLENGFVFDIECGEDDIDFYIKDIDE